MANTSKKKRTTVQELNAAARNHPAVTPELRVLLRAAARELKKAHEQVDAWEAFREDVGSRLRTRWSYAGDPNPGGTEMLDELYNDMPPEPKGTKR